MVIGEQAEGCGGWIPSEYRMCASSLAHNASSVAPRPAVFVSARKGSWSSTPVDETALEMPNGQHLAAFEPQPQPEPLSPNLSLTTSLNPEPGCRQHALFHFQEWKKNWDEPSSAAGGGRSRIAPLRPADTLSSPAFRITADGISPLTIPQS